MIDLVKDTIDKKDIDNLIEWLKTYPKLTKGDITLQFERKWSKFLGRKHSVFVNSGSSANLLMIYALMRSKRLKNNKIVVPAVCWSTSISPIMQLGLEPIICDVDSKNLCASYSSLEYIFQREEPSAFLLVNILGFSCDSRIKQLCEKYNVTLLEDSCESVGTIDDNGDLAGTIGLMSTFSGYFGHHWSCIEGGIISTDDEELNDILLMIRSHGWARDLEESKQKKLRKEWNVTEFNDKYTFYHPGFNVRATEIQAFLGLNQIDKLQRSISNRNYNFRLYQKYIVNSYWKPDPKGFISNFAYPVIHPARESIVNTLRNNGIETRPIVCGNICSQPFFKEQYGIKLADFARFVHEYGFYVPNHPDIKERDIKMICDIINWKINENFVQR